MGVETAKVQSIAMCVDATMGADMKALE